LRNPEKSFDPFLLFLFLFLFFSAGERELTLSEMSACVPQQIMLSLQASLAYLLLPEGMPFLKEVRLKGDSASFFTFSQKGESGIPEIPELYDLGLTEHQISLILDIFSAYSDDRGFLSKPQFKLLFAECLAFSTVKHRPRDQECRAILREAIKEEFLLEDLDLDSCFFERTWSYLDEDGEGYIDLHHFGRGMKKISLSGRTEDYGYYMFFLTDVEGVKAISRENTASLFEDFVSIYGTLHKNIYRIDEAYMAMLGIPQSLTLTLTLTLIGGLHGYVRDTSIPNPNPNPNWRLTWLC